MTSWDVIGKAADVVQHTGCDAVRLIGMIAQAANTARMHKRNCRQFAQHLKLIGNLLEQLKISELKKYPETREPLEQLEDALRRSYILVTSCQDRSYLYLLAMGWKIVYQFREAQNEIDRCLKLIPLITLVDNTRVRERLEVIEMDQREYALDDEDQKVKSLIFAQEPCKHDTLMLKKTLSCSYPNMCFNEALRKENEKLKLELQRSRANLDVSRCEVIQHLLDVIEAVASNSLPDDGSPVKRSEKKEKRTSGGNSAGEHSSGETYSKKTNRNSSSVSLDHDRLSSKGSYDYGEWHTYLLGCCSEPLLCIKTLFCPCGTFSRIASVAKGRHMSSAEACICFLSCSLIFSCCCYTCCVRRKLRKMLNIREWREVKIRGIGGTEKAKTGPPPSQYMEY